MELLMEATDEDLLRTGDVAGLVRRYYGPVYGLARRLLGNPSDARDAAQETFTRAIGHLGGFDRRSSFRTWLFAITANHIRDLLRRKKQLRLDPSTEDSLPVLTLPEHPLFLREDRDRVLGALDRLPFDLKIVVTLQFQQDLSYREIAETLGISVNAVRIRIYRALAALRKELS
jgi:RNA polymerase sigma-70 factor (ECF subfamily)